ncbi:MAG: hypothetical protein ACI81L_000729 [Verrucomicrobiales bacterium]|jgi:hypothetical protein
MPAAFVQAVNDGDVGEPPTDLSDRLLDGLVEFFECCNDSEVLVALGSESSRWPEPRVQSPVIDLDAAFCEEFFDVAVGQAVLEIRADGSMMTSGGNR